MNQAKLQDLEPDVRDLQDDIRLQLRLNRAFERELSCHIQYLQHKRNALNYHSSLLRTQHYQHEVALHPITKCKPPQTRKRRAKPFTKGETLEQLAKLCDQETADLVANLLKEGKE